MSTKNVVYKVVGKTKRKKAVFQSESLDECFDFVIEILRKEKKRKRHKEEEKAQNFLDFGTIES